MWGAIDWLPRIPRQKEPPGRPHSFDDAQVAARLALEPSDAVHCLCMFLEFTGCRIDEVLSMLWTDVDRDDGLAIFGRREERRCA